MEKLDIFPNLVYCVIQGQIFKLDNSVCHSFVQAMLQYSEVIIHSNGEVLKSRYSLSDNNYGLYLAKLIKNTDIPLTEGKSVEDARRIFIKIAEMADRISQYNAWRKFDD